MKAETLPREIFRAYDVRGIVGEQLTEETATLIGSALATKALAVGVRRLAIGRDGRQSSPSLAQALATGINQAGLDTIDIGLCPTPALYWAACELAEGNGAMVTGSHNPVQYNGIKMMLGGSALAGDEIQQLFLLITEKRLTSRRGGAGEHSSNSQIIDSYLADLLAGRSLARPVKVVVDCGNGAAGPLAPAALERLGCEVVPLYEQVDGTFPNHHPDPADPKNFADAIAAMDREQAEMAIAFDGDGDRIGVALPGSGIIYPDRMLMALARDFLAANPGEKIVYDVKCSRLVGDFIAERGGTPVMCRTGHSFVKQEMEKSAARLGGELSGHMFFHEGRWRFDDALLAAVKLAVLAAGHESATELFTQIPDAPASPEIKIDLPAESPPPAELVEELLANPGFASAPEKIITIDGLRAEWPDGFGLVRASNTTKSLIMRFEGDCTQSLARIHNQFSDRLKQLGLVLPAP